MKEYTTRINTNGTRETVGVSIICDRCGKRYEKNERYLFDGTKCRGTLTGIRFLCNKSWHMPRKDLCDDCLSDIMETIYGSMHALNHRLDKDKIIPNDSAREVQE